MTEKEFEDLKNVIQWMEIKLIGLQREHRAETGRDFVISGHRKEPTVGELLRVVGNID